MLQVAGIELQLLQQQVAAAEAQLDAERSTHADVHQQLADLQGQCKVAREQLDQHISQASVADAAVTDVQLKLDEVTRALADEQEQHVMTKTASAAAAQQLQESSSQVEQLQQTVSEMQHKMEKKEQQLVWVSTDSQT